MMRLIRIWSLISLLVAALGLALPAWSQEQAAEGGSPAAESADSAGAPADESSGGDAENEAEQTGEQAEATLEDDGGFLGGETFLKGESIRVDENETLTGDRYGLAMPEVTIDGLYDGDLAAIWIENLDIEGEVTGDVVVWANAIEIDGVVRDSVRVFGNAVTISGTIEGDLIVIGTQVRVVDGAHITGNAWIMGARSRFGGRIDGNLSAKGGELEMSGSVGGQARLTFDSIDFEDDFEVGGNLRYSSRREEDPASAGTIGGQVLYQGQKADDDDDEEEASSSGQKIWERILEWNWMLLRSILLGLLILALARGVLLRAIDSSAGSQLLFGGLVGFGSSIVWPVAVVAVALVMMVVPAAVFDTLGGSTLSAAVLTTLVFTVLGTLLTWLALYLGKIPIALMTGRRLLKMAGAKKDSPALALVLGLFVLHLLFAVPFIGTLSWFFVAWAGLGTVVLWAFRRKAEIEDENAVVEL
ncbi:hypothetical protein ABI59_09660 [Acidobacteria bacterium Mor1]|nr:hypothetical protein ABI59_09660 [Acidobacteria bacterium Mor1]